MESWYQEKGFIKNPFALEPVGASEEEIKGFVNRIKERAVLEKFIQQTTGSLIVVAEVGVGKSSFLNLTENYSRKRKKLVVRIDPRTINDDINLFIECLLKELEKEFSNSDKGEMLELMKSSLEKNREDFIQTTKLLEEFFEKNECILIMDDLDKLSLKKHIDFLKKIIDLLPQNLQIITTGDLHQIITSKKIVNLLYKFFDSILLLETAGTKEKLREFIDSKMAIHAIGKIKISFKDEILDVLLDRTRGNLREIYRYLSELTKSGDYSKESLINIMKEVDKIRIKSLDGLDRRILLAISGELSVLNDIQKIVNAKSKSTLRFRLDGLTQSGFVFKYQDESSNKLIYSSPDILKELITDSWSPHEVKV